METSVVSRKFVKEQPQSDMERSSTRNHENATADPSPSLVQGQDDKVQGWSGNFQDRSFDFVWPVSGQTALRITA
jgi:hypothetical protein